MRWTWLGVRQLAKDVDARLVASLPQQIAVKAVIVVPEEDAFAPVVT